MLNTCVRVDERRSNCLMVAIGVQDGDEPMAWGPIVPMQPEVVQQVVEQMRPEFVEWAAGGERPAWFRTVLPQVQV